MSRPREKPSENEADFREKYDEVRAKYEKVYRELIHQNDARFAHRGTEPMAPLEAHLRQYFVDPFLKALNWRLDASDYEGAPNAFPETRVLSATKGTIRRLDYLGIDRETMKPLMIVEAKTPASDLPKLRPSGDEFERKLSDSHASVIAAGLEGAELMLDWNEWLSDLRAYVRDIWQESKTVPARAILTNGRWLIVFTDPDNCFLHFDERDHRIDETSILVFQYGGRVDADEFNERCKDIFNLLEYGHVLGDAPVIKPVQLRAYIRSKTVERAMHGLWIRHSEDEDRRSSPPAPKIRVQPVVFLRLGRGAWLRVETGRDNLLEVPADTDYKSLRKHLRTVRKEALKLLRSIEHSLGSAIAVDELGNHYRDPASFKALRGVRRLASRGSTREYLLVTGKNTHFLKPPERIVTNCRHHDWSNSNKQGCAATDGPIMLRSATERSFFKSTERHHCTHSDVATIKRNPVSSLGPGRPRRDSPNGRFCEIWNFEQQLCCRTCAFEDACAQERVFTLPCKKQQPPSR